ILKFAFAERTCRQTAELTADHTAEGPAERTYCASDPGSGDAGDLTKNRRGSTHKTADAPRDAAEPPQELFAFKFAFKFALAFKLEFAFIFALEFRLAFALAAQQTADAPGDRA